MATHSKLNIQHKPIRLLRYMDNKHATPTAVNTLTPIIKIISRETPTYPSKARITKRDPFWSKLSISDVIRKLRSSDTSIVLQAVDELRVRGCLSSNALSWICLQYANMQGANLSAFNLKSADLSKAHLEMADLSYANLSGARLTRARMEFVNLEKASLKNANLIGVNLEGAKNLSDEQMAQVGKMRGAILPDGTLYDGRFNLPGDFADASILHVDLNDPSAIAAFYGISPDDFLNGQKWRQEHMPSISVWRESVCYQNAEMIMTR